MQERFEHLSAKIDIYASATRYILTRYLTRKSRDVMNISDINDVLSMMNTLPWQRLETLRWRTAELSDIYKKRGDVDRYEDCLDICDVIEDTLMIKIHEDPLAPINLKKRAAKYIENYKRETYKEALSPPQK